MKIAILTLPLSTNYGGILQNYALQQVLKDMGHIPYTFDLGQFTWIDCMVFNIKSIAKKILGRPSHFILSPKDYLQQERPLRIFVENHITLLSPRVKRPTSAMLDRYDIDAVIVGSDQVWRAKYYPYAEDMFLKFVKNEKTMKIAYAASFGKHQWEYSTEKTSQCKSWIKDFRAISVREKSGVDVCNTVLGVNAVHVLDPTLLLTDDRYKCLISNVPINKNRLLFAYLLDVTETKISYIQSVSTRKGLVPIITSAGRDLTQDDSVELWLSYFRDASYVITDSFHGTVFSIIFKKDFTTITNKNRGNDRMLSLLTSLHLTNRLEDVCEKEENISSVTIDWNAVNERLETMRNESRNFLSQALKR